MGAERAVWASDRIYLILGIYRDKMPSEAVKALQGVAADLAAPEPAQSLEAVAWQIVDRIDGPMGYLGVTEDAAWDKMTKATGFDRIAWSEDRFARPLYAAPPAQAGEPGACGECGARRQSTPSMLPTRAGEAVAWEATGRYGGAPATEYGDSEENARWIYRVRYGAMPDAVRPLVYADPSRPGGA